MTFATLPTNRNFLSPLGFRLVFNRLPTVEYFCQSVTLPSVGLQVMSVSNPLMRLNVAGTQLQYGELSATFKIDEDMKNYVELYNWISDLSFNRETSQYANLLAAQVPGGNGGPRSDATIEILNSVKNANKAFHFTDVFPASLTPVSFDTRKADIDYLECTVNFSFRDFTITAP